MMSMNEFMHFGISNRMVNKNLITDKITETYVIRAFCGEKTSNSKEVSSRFEGTTFSCPKCKVLAKSVTNMLEFYELKRLVRGDD